MSELKMLLNINILQPDLVQIIMIWVGLLIYPDVACGIQQYLD